MTCPSACTPGDVAVGVHAAIGAAVVPRIRFHGVLAPNANLRAQVVPSVPAAGAEAASSPAAGEANCAHHTLARLSWARLLKRVFSRPLALPELRPRAQFIAAILERR